MSDSPESPITFYRLQGCPYCERVARRLREYGLDYRSRYVEPMHSSRDAVKRVAGVRTVPVIVDERTGVTMAESGNVVDYLERTYGPDADGHPASEKGETVADGSGADDSSAETGRVGNSSAGGRD